MLGKKIPVVFLWVIVIFFAVGAFAQNAPISTVTTVFNAVPGPVSVPITVVNFTSISAVSLTLEYDYSLIHYVSAVTNTLFPTMSFNDNDLGNGFHRVIIGWYGNPHTLTNGSALITINFTYISGIAAINWIDNGPSCEYADGNNNVLNDIPTSTYYINGYICGIMGTPGTISGPSSVCQGQNGVGYSVNEMANVTGYNWTVPSGAIIAGGTNTNAITVNFASNASSGNISVTGSNPCGTSSASTLAVTLNTLPVANAGNDTTIPYGTSTILHASSGGSGSYNYHWTPEALLVNPNIQNPQTVNLTSTTIFTVTVTNQTTLCQNSDAVIVTISGGVLSVNPMAVPSEICHGDIAQLFANAGGGSGNYTYTWTCTPTGSPPWTSNLANPTVSPDSSTNYHLSVYDGFNTTTGNAYLPVFQRPTATMTGGDTLCGQGLTTTLQVLLTGTPPWNFVYSNGLNTFTVINTNTNPYNIVTADSGTYTILNVNDFHCVGTTSGTAVVAVFPVPATPTISLIYLQLISTSCCGNQWYKDGVLIPGAIHQTYVVTQTAHYYDIITLHGCVSDTSNDLYVVMTGIHDPVTQNFCIEPNPASQVIHISAKSKLTGAITIRFLSLQGVVLKEINIDNFTDNQGVFIDISNFKPGLYLAYFTSGETTNVLKLLVK
ncbi:MAG: cohesin domain-containing protein [Bacteroidetes bacterium]|nr:cohesin domain-containing protein [Bacteroidota bacterium]